MKLFATLLLLTVLLCGCAASDSPSTTSPPETTETTEATVPVTRPAPPPPDEIRLMLNNMSLEERVGQLFLARCREETAISDLETYHLGGYVLFAEDFEGETVASVQEKLSAYQAAAKIPLLLAVDEEGGTVTRVSRFPAFRDSRFPSPRSLYAQGGLNAVLTAEEEKSLLLSNLGLNVNLAPVCDITTEPGAFLYDRSLGQSPEVTAEFIQETVSVMAQYGVGSCLKHFPGYGNNADTHTGIARDSRSFADLRQRDLVPFHAGIEAGCGAILVSHTIVDAFDPFLPASLSLAVHTYLRQDMGFQGVIVTDDLVMQAITDQYGAGEAAVMAVLAGNDLLCSTDFPVQYKAVLAAVLDGRIDIDVLNSAVRRVLQWKIDLGLI